jgi:glyoxylase-like metal-dependent hydrolase (beta-lactamase superfamily II)
MRKMNQFICTTCGTQYPASGAPPNLCTICEEERQYVSPNGQVWTTLEDLIQSQQYENNIQLEEENLYSITTSPSFGIGQTAYLVKGKDYNLLWDCITFIDENTIEKIAQLGGINAIALSHPHYYSAQIEWAEAFGVPIYIHEDDQEWIMNPSDHIILWSGETLVLNEGMTIHRLGGHFKGGAVLHWEAGNEGKGVLLTGDIIQVVANRKWVSFMYSYPNLIPLPAKKVREMVEKVKPLSFNRIYNAFHKIVKEDANHSVQLSADRYIKAIQGEWFQT